MNTIGFKVKNRFKLIRISAQGDEVDSSDWSNNMVLDSGLVSILSSGSIDMRAVCGTGNSAVSPSDVSLSSFLQGAQGFAIENSTDRVYASSPRYIKHTWRWRFDQGSVVGNISEVGVAISLGQPTSSTPLFSRALVSDSSGNPTTVTVLSDEFLDVVYELYIYAPDDRSGTFPQNIDSSIVTTSYTILPANMADDSTTGWRSNYAAGMYGIFPEAGTGNSLAVASTGTTGSAGGSITGTQNSFSSAAWISPVNSSPFYRDVRYTASLSESNINISAFQFSMGMCAFQMSLSPAVAKVNTKTYRLDLRITLERV